MAHKLITFSLYKIIVRDSEGYVLGCAAVRIERVTDPNIAEAIAACKAMEFAS